MRSAAFAVPSARTLCVSIALLSSVSYAGTGDLTVSFSSGIVADWTGKTLGLAVGFLPFLFLVSLMAEGAKPAGEARNFGAVVQRFFFIFVLLKSYGAVFGNLAMMIQGAADSIATRDVWQKLQTATEEFLKAKAQYAQQNANGSSGGGYALAQMANIVDSIGGQLIDSVVTLIVLAGQAAFRIVGTLGGVLSLLLYVVGPLAIAGSMPRSSDAGSKWLRVFISVLSWPLISAVMVGLLTNYALDALKPHQPYEAAYASIALAGILTITAFAVPVVASALTGAGIGAVGAGWSSMGAWVGAAASGAGAVANTAGAMAGAGQRPAMQAAGAAASAAAGGGGIQTSAPTASTSNSYQGDQAQPQLGIPQQAAAQSRVGNGMRGDVASGGGGPASSMPQHQQPPPFVESRRPNDAAPLAHASLPSPANLARNERLDANGNSERGGSGLQPASAPAQSVAPLPKKYAQAIENWSKANPRGDLNAQQSRQEILQEHARLQRGGGEPVTQRVPDPPKHSARPSLTPTKPLKP